MSCRQPESTLYLNSSLEFKDHYRTLGVSSTANLSVIKTSYRKLSKKFHPDVNDGDKFFEERFKEIQEAYEILSDDIKRRRYDFDRFGKEQSFQGFHEKDQDFKKEPESPNQDKSFTEEDLNANTKENNSKGTAHKPLKK